MQHSAHFDGHLFTDCSGKGSSEHFSGNKDFTDNKSTLLDFLHAESFGIADLTSQNGSGVTGAALLALDHDTNTLAVAIAATGLEPGQVHPQHIHGFSDNRDSQLPSPSQDADQDGFIEIAEGQVTIGPPLLDLTSPPGSGPSGFPIADANGTVLFAENYQLPAQMLGEDPLLSLRSVELHGLSLFAGEGSDGGEADGTAGYKTSLPVAAGEIQDVTTLASAGFLSAVSPDLLSELSPASFGDEAAFAANQLTAPNAQEGSGVIASATQAAGTADQTALAAEQQTAPPDGQQATGTITGAPGTDQGAPGASPSSAPTDTQQIAGTTTGDLPPSTVGMDQAALAQQTTITTTAGGTGTDPNAAAAAQGPTLTDGQAVGSTTAFGPPDGGATDQAALAAGQNTATTDGQLDAVSTRSGPEFAATGIIDHSFCASIFAHMTGETVVDAQSDLLLA